jgi:DMSO/TMAO reductase YedYZ heme-binding membrane subunit
MHFLTALIGTVIAVFLLRKAIAKVPAVFYILGFAVIALYLYEYYLGSSSQLWRSVFPYIQRGSIGLALFTIVMFTGAFARESKLRMMLQPIRRQLSILGAIMCSGHVLVYLWVFWERWLAFTEGMRLNAWVAVLLALVITALLVVLTVTSFVVVRKRMPPKAWANVQQFSYLFYLLIYIHLMLFLEPSAAYRVWDAQVTLMVYTVVFGVYIVLRLRRNWIDRKAEREAALAAATQRVEQDPC